MYKLSIFLTIGACILLFGANSAAENSEKRIWACKVSPDAEEDLWLVEMGSRNGMLRNGWTEDTIKPGDELRVTGAPGRKEPNIMHQDGITTLDGAPVGPQR